MLVKAIELKNFRNYKYLSLNFDQKVNIFYGNNAQGKTNILESVYLCGTTKSHKGSKDKEMIQFLSEESHIKMIIEKNEIPYKIDMHLRKNSTKGIAINGIPIKKASELFGLVHFIFFSPEDLNLIKNGPNERRRFLDLELCQLDKLYLQYLTKYNKIINQRNKLLKEISFRQELMDTLDIWDEQLVKYGIFIIEKRSQFIRQLNEIAYGVHSKLTGNKETLFIKYENNVSTQNFQDWLKKNREKDIRQGITSVGPHRDDICLAIENIDIRKYGSQGQQRTVALTLKLSEISLVKDIIKENPVLLLDDVLSELDHDRQNYLLNCIGDIQTFITCTGIDEFVNNRFSFNKIFKVENGSVMNEN